MKRNPKFAAVDRAVKEQGWKVRYDLMQVVVLFRLAPVIPFGLKNYMLAATSISVPIILKQLWTVMWASMIGCFPGAVMFSFVGSLVEGFTSAAAVETPLKGQAVLTQCD